MLTSAPIRLRRDGRIPGRRGSCATSAETLHTILLGDPGAKVGTIVIHRSGDVWAARVCIHGTEDSAEVLGGSPRKSWNATS